MAAARSARRRCGPMRVIKDNAIVQDGWQLLGSEEALPAGDVIVPLARWRAEREALARREGRLGVAIDGEAALEELAADLGRFALIALEFPAFSDGRCFSHARVLRERYGYRGELRAVGDVLRDQLYFMQRCGIDSFALRSDKDFDDALKAFGEFSVRYQSAADGAAPIYRLR